MHETKFALMYFRLFLFSFSPLYTFRCISRAAVVQPTVSSQRRSAQVTAKARTRWRAAAGRQSSWVDLWPLKWSPQSQRFGITKAPSSRSTMCSLGANDARPSADSEVEQRKRPLSWASKPPVWYWSACFIKNRLVGTCLCSCLGRELCFGPVCESAS